MDQQNGTGKSTHIKSFWAITIVAVVAIIAGGLVYWFQFQFAYNEEINSLEIRMQRKAHSDNATSTANIPVKSATSTKVK